MWRNYLAAAFRNLARSRLYTGISIFGLAIGLCAAIIVALVIRSELSYDHFIPGHERTYLVTSSFTNPGRPSTYKDTTHHQLAAVLKSQFRQIEAITRLFPMPVLLQQDQVRELLYWADPNVFDVLPLPVFAGDLKTALRKPDSIVLPRSIARKYLGHDSPVGETIRINRANGAHYSMTVTAVIEDLPAHGTHLLSGIFASGISAGSYLLKQDNDPARSIRNLGWSYGIAATYLRVASDASPAGIDSVLPAVADAVWPQSKRTPGVSFSLNLLPLDRMHLAPELERYAPDGLSFKSQTTPSRLAAMAVIGALILFIACVNFINLTTARSARRALEVGIRKVSGASHRSLILQFLGESQIHVLLAACLAVALAELLLPPVNAFLGSGAVLDYWNNPELIAWIVLGALALGVLAGAYPAFVLSAFRPSAVLKGRLTHSGGSIARHSLVTMQFSILIGLTIAAAMVYQQRIFATRDALRVDTDQVLIIDSLHNEALMNELRALPGVRAVSCTSNSFLTGASLVTSSVRQKDGSMLAINLVPVDSQAFSLYGLQPAAGRFFPAEPGQAAAASTARFVINQTAVKRLGFTSAESSIGQPITTQSELPYGNMTGDIVGVVPDFSLTSVKEEIAPVAYYVSRNCGHINVKLTGRAIPETLAAVDLLWKAAGAPYPIKRYFLDDHIQNLYLTMLRETQLFGFFAGIAILLACLGLTGLAASTVQRRTGEIGLRKAMGATTGQITRLLLWEFSRPVLWASLIAWPASAILMNRWLEGFAYHVDLDPLLFVAATAFALVIALLTVSAHCYLVARSKPVKALRHE